MVVEQKSQWARYVRLDGVAASSANIVAFNAQPLVSVLGNSVETASRPILTNVKIEGLQGSVPSVLRIESRKDPLGVLGAVLLTLAEFHIPASTSFVKTLDFAEGIPGFGRFTGDDRPARLVISRYSILATPALINFNAANGFTDGTLPCFLTASGFFQPIRYITFDSDTGA